ncbi:serine/arginine repetitive matrix protein 3-like [Delphinus delphis]|uniref:serine/arginine repetitive matrix protein 3-like n=1 Tax=Delphinus delphis TaxID=9728 RepID=UPI00375301F7
MYFPKRTGTPGGKAQSEGAHPARPAWPGFRGAARAAAGTRAGRRAQPVRARPQARLIFMSGREPPLLHGRPAGPRRPPPAFVPFPPPAGLPSLRTRGRGPSAPAGRPPPLPPAPRQRRGGLARGGGKGGSQRRARLSLSTRPPALRPIRTEPAGHRTARPSRPARTGPSGRTSQRCPPPPPRSEAAAAPGRPLPGTAATCPGRPRALGRRGRAWGGAAAAGLSPRLAGPGRGRARAPATAK